MDPPPASAAPERTEAFRTLCGLMEEEVARQEQVLAAVQAQGAAARSREVVSLGQISERLAALLQQAALAEKQRRQVIDDICGHTHFSQAGRCLSDLLPLAPEPLQEQLTRVQRRLQALLSATRAAVRGNHQFFRRGLNAAGAAIGQVTQQRPTTGASAYTHGGGYAAHTAPRAAFVDNRG